jgi:hypothetical protein
MGAAAGWGDLGAFFFTGAGAWSGSGSERGALTTGSGGEGLATGCTAGGGAGLREAGLAEPRAMTAPTPNTSARTPPVTVPHLQSEPRLGGAGGGSARGPGVAGEGCRVAVGG